MLSVGLTCQVYLLEIEGLFTRGSRRGRSSGNWVGEIFTLDSSERSNAPRYHNFDIKPDTELKVPTGESRGCEGPGPCRGQSWSKTALEVWARRTEDCARFSMWCVPQCCVGSMVAECDRTGPGSMSGSCSGAALQGPNPTVRV